MVIINSGIRHFLFPFDRCRSIVHSAPKPNTSTEKRLVIFATFSISGLGQGMDLKSSYIPFVSGSKPTKQNAIALQTLRNHWRITLGIEKSILAENSYRHSKLECGLSNLGSIKFTVFERHPKKRQGTHNQYRIANFGFRQFKNECETENNILINNAIPVGELARTLYFFSQIGKYSFNKLSQTNNPLLHHTDCSLLGNNNYDLIVQFRQPDKAFQFLNMDEILDHIDQLVLILYRGAKNYIYPASECEHYQHSLPFEREKIFNASNFTQKQLYKNNIAQIFTSFPSNEIKDIKLYFLLSHSLEIARKRGARSTVIKKKQHVFLININKLNKNMTTPKQNLRGVDKVPFFLPRTGINRTLQGVDLGSQLIELSKKIICKSDSHKILSSY